MEPRLWYLSCQRQMILNYAAMFLSWIGKMCNTRTCSNDYCVKFRFPILSKRLNVVGLSIMKSTVDLPLCLLVHQIWWTDSSESRKIEIHRHPHDTSCGHKKKITISHIQSCFTEWSTRIGHYLVKERNVHHLRVHHERIKVRPQIRNY